jgi:hypothetical protein
MWDKVLQLLFVNCRHRHLSKPFSAAHEDGGFLASSHYVVCLDCSRHFGYDWNAMRVNWRDQPSARRSRAAR